MKSKYLLELNELFSIKRLIEAEKKAKKGKGYRKDIAHFQTNYINNIKSIHKKLLDKEYVFGPYKEFTLFDSKRRLVITSPYDDRIVHWILYDYLEKIYEKKFIFDSYGNRKNKGTHKAAKKAFNYSRSIKSNYVLSVDFSKYFYSIHHKTLKEILIKSISNTYILDILCNLIDSFKTKNHFDNLFASHSKYRKTTRKGIPIGSLVSQIFANIYLNSLDHYLKDYLGVKKYIRYVDDIIVFTETIEDSRKIKEAIINYSYSKLNLEINPKKVKIMKLGNKPFTFLGQRISKTTLKASKKNMIRSRKRKTLYHYKSKDTHMDKITAFY